MVRKQLIDTRFRKSGDIFASHLFVGKEELVADIRFQQRMNGISVTPGLRNLLEACVRQLV